MGGTTPYPVNENDSQMCQRAQTPWIYKHENFRIYFL